MREIAEAFIDNHSLKSFCVRNTCRPPKDLFPEILKEGRKSYGIQNNIIPKFNRLALCSGFSNPK